MNIIEMHEDIKVKIDFTRSPRYDANQYDTAIKTVSRQILADRYDNIKIRKPYNFQSMQRLRDELWTLIKSTTIAITSDLLPASSILALTDYRYALSCSIELDGVYYDCTPTSYSELPTLQKNFYKRAQITEPYRVYFIESASGLTFFHNSDYAPTNVKLDYLKEPLSVYSGVQGTSATVYAIGNVLIAMEPTVYNGVTYAPGQLITIVAGFLSITSGKVVFGYVNSEFPLAIHDEICNRAGSLLSGGSSDYQKKMSLENDANRQ